MMTPVVHWQRSPVFFPHSMPVEHVGSLADVGADIRDAQFVDDEHVVLIDSLANVWQTRLGALHVMELIHPAGDVLQSLATSFAKRTMLPAGGWYPRLAELGGASGPLVINTHDRVLITQEAAGSAWRIVMAKWGLYYPRLAPSPNGRYLACADEELIIFDRRTWEAKSLGEFDFAWAWTGEDTLICAGPHGFRALDCGVERWPTWRELGGGLDAYAVIPLLGGEQCAVLTREHLSLVDVVGGRERMLGRSAELPAEEFHFAVSAARSAPRAALVGRGGAMVWDLARLAPIAGPLPNVDRARLSPSGRMLLTFERSSASRRPGASPVTAMPSIWRVD
jgi:hypothetical protein